MITDLRFFALVALIACLEPFGFAGVAYAQQPATPRHVGFALIGFSPESKKVQEFRQELLGAGYSEGDIVIEWRNSSSSSTSRLQKPSGSRSPDPSCCKPMR
jgi:hypothetical protein